MKKNAMQKVYAKNDNIQMNCSITESYIFFTICM